MSPEVITLDLKTQQLQCKPKPPAAAEKKHLKPVIRVTTAENGTQVGVLTTVHGMLGHLFT